MHVPVHQSGIREDDVVTIPDGRVAEVVHIDDHPEIVVRPLPPGTDMGEIRDHLPLMVCTADQLTVIDADQFDALMDTATA